MQKAKEQPYVRKYRKLYKMAQRKEKSAGVALFLTFLFGPFGMLYASILWSIIFMILHVVAFALSFGVINVPLHFINMFVSYQIVADHNHRIKKAAMEIQWMSTQARANGISVDASAGNP